MAAEQGHIVAIGMIGRCYLGSRLKSRDIIKECFRLVAEKGADAQTRGKYCYYLASMYSEDGDDANHVKWLVRSSDEGHGEASFKLSAYYLSGSHVEADNRKAADYLCRAGEMLGGVAFLSWLNRSGARFWDRRDWDKRKRCLVSIHPQMAEDGIQVFVKNLCGKSVTVPTRLSDRVITLKKSIYDREAIPPGRQRLIFSGKELEDNKAISEYNIQKESTIQLSLRLISASKFVCELPSGESICLEVSRFDSVSEIKSKLEAASAKRGLQYPAKNQLLLHYVEAANTSWPWCKLEDADLLATYMSKVPKGVLRVKLHIPSQGATLLLFVVIKTRRGDMFATDGTDAIHENMLLDATPDYVIETVESKIARMCDLSPDRIVLSHNHGPLVGGTFIKDYDIKDGDKLFAEVGMRVLICPHGVKSRTGGKLIGNFELAVDADIDNLKRRIELKHSIPVKEQVISIATTKGGRLVMRAKAGSTIMNLSDYGVRDGSTLYLSDDGREKDIGIIMFQTSCSRAKAVAALEENEGDVKNAIMSLKAPQERVKEESKQKSKKKTKKSKKKKSGRKSKK